MDHSQYNAVSMPDAFSKPLSVPQRSAALALCALAIALRAPQLVLQPRLWAEELTVHLSHAFSHGALQSLLLVPTTAGPAGYFQIPANLAAVLSTHLTTIEAAATVALSLAALCQLAPIALLLFGHSRLWNTPLRQLSACAVLIFGPPVVPEVWLSTINSQIFCGLLAFLLLFEDLRDQSVRRRWLDRCLLVFCGLSGVYTSLLTLPFLLRVRLEEDPEARREALTRAFLVAAIALAQAVIYAVTVLSVSLAPSRVAQIYERAAETLFFYQILHPVLGEPLAGKLLAGFSSAVPAPTLANGICLLFLLAAVLWLSQRPHEDPLLLLFPCTFLTLAATTAALGFGLPRGRYAVLSGLVLLLWLLTIAWSAQARRRWICAGLVALSLGVGLVTFRNDQILAHRGEPVSYFGTLSAGRVAWREEVELWRRDPYHSLRVWPYKASDSWKAHLVHRSAFDDLRQPLSAFDEIHLTTGRTPVESRLVLPQVPVEFRLVVRGTSSRSHREVACEVSLTNALGQELMHYPLQYRADEKFARHHAVSLASELEIGVPPYTLTLRATSRDAQMATVTISQVQIVSRVQGLFDSTVPFNALPQALYTHSTQGPLSPETTSLLALESLVEDGDLLWSKSDAQRAAKRWRGPPNGLQLRRLGEEPDRLVLHTPAAYLLIASPFFSFGGPGGVVLLQLVLLAGMVLAVHWVAPPENRLFLLGSLLASAGLGFTFLPAPQIFEAFCLLLPLCLWLQDQLNGRRALLAGMLLGLAIFQNPLWIALSALPIAEQTYRKRRPPWHLLAMLACTLVVLFLLSLLWVDPPFGETEPAAAPKIASTVPEGPFLQRTLSGIRQFYAAPNGLLLGYPFLVLGLLAWLRRPDESPRRLALGVVLLLLISWFALRAPHNTELGNPYLPILAPLVALLPTRPLNRWALLAAGVVALLFSWGIAATAWNRLG